MCWIRIDPWDQSKICSTDAFVARRKASARKDLRSEDDDIPPRQPTLRVHRGTKAILGICQISVASATDPRDWCNQRRPSNKGMMCTTIAGWYKSRRQSVPLNRLCAALLRRRKSVPVLVSRLDAVDRH
jgi:hypothetical protein